jgi:hypothetical protein
VKKKGLFQGQNLENDNNPIPLALEAIPLAREASPKGCLEGPKKPSGHNQDDSQKEDNVLTFINTLMVNTSITSSSGPILAIVDADESQKASEELRGVEPPPNVMSSYSFVG